MLIKSWVSKIKEEYTYEQSMWTNYLIFHNLSGERYLDFIGNEIENRLEQLSVKHVSF